MYLYSKMGVEKEESKEKLNIQVAIQQIKSTPQILAGGGGQTAF